VNKRGYKTTIEGLSYKFNPVFWNYAKLISGTLRHGMPIHKVVELVTSLQLDNETINSWKAGVARALKKYIPNGTLAEDAHCAKNAAPMKSYTRKDVSPVCRAALQNADNSIFSERFQL
jgi:ribonucleoside-diphosphate reductase alpha chain